MIYSEEMALHTGEETEWTSATTGATYSPKTNGKLIQIKLFFGQTSAIVIGKLNYYTKRQWLPLQAQGYSVHSGELMHRSAYREQVFKQHQPSRTL